MVHACGLIFPFHFIPPAAIYRPRCLVPITLIAIKCNTFTFMKHRLLQRKQIIIKKNIQSQVVTICTTCFNTLKLCILPHSSTILDRGTWWRWTVNDQVPITHYIWGWVDSMGGLQVLTLPRIEPRFLGCPAHSLVATPTDLFRLTICNPMPKYLLQTTYIVVWAILLYRYGQWAID
jgi:hypothetical protein